jgi:hypothetical protein
MYDFCGKCQVQMQMQMHMLYRDFAPVPCGLETSGKNDFSHIIIEKQ